MVKPTASINRSPISIMKIAYYMPFKPMGHINPSGDLITGSELFTFFQKNGHTIFLASDLRCRWIYYKPWTWWKLGKDIIRLNKQVKQNRPDIWLTYHSYYKAPDLLGLIISKKNNIPYAIFQGVYSTKRRKKISSWFGFQLNKKVLSNANLVFTNKRVDEKNLLRLLPPERIAYIAPGLHPKNFQFDLVSRKSLRARWNFENKKIVMSAAMFRPGVKTEGLMQVIDSCAQLLDNKTELKLLIAGDGTNRQMLKDYAREKLGENVLFLGKIPRHELYRYYSAADIFAFPGINESLGMVYLEAQSCGLPVVAFRNWGASEAVVHEKTGFLLTHPNFEGFQEAIRTLLTDNTLRKKMRDDAKDHVMAKHDIEKNYTVMLEHLRNPTYQTDQGIS